MSGRSEVDAGGGKGLRQLLARAPRAGPRRIDQAHRRDVDAARDVALLRRRTRLRIPAGEPAGRAGVRDLPAPSPTPSPAEGSQHVLAACHQLRAEARGEGRLRPRPCRPALDRPARGFPGGEAAVEHGDGVVAKAAEHPPDPRRRQRSLRVVGDDQGLVADAKGADAVGKHLGRRQHMRQRARLVANPVDVEEGRTRDVPGLEVGAGNAAAARHMEAAVEDAHTRIVQMLRQPRRGRRGGRAAAPRTGRLHGALSSHAGTGSPLPRRNAGL